MQFRLTTALLAVTAALGGVAATPAAPKVRAAQASLVVCTDKNFSGKCQSIGFNNAQCVVFPSGFQKDISSIAPPSGWVCDAYIDLVCTGDGLGDITSPGISDLGDHHTNYNDRLNSFVCYTT
ncbi:hypothetical protein PsYK624_085850 [Phanerochaete sordida]|uniref:Uncharacterized protein n=1 Tax=Phanerochaete sordida TaxID=48140 RepID=A0A9P3GCV0_9APHY|nr:hypothetical protein PsYK624_085850 [Phanerochaete sordida]